MEFTPRLCAYFFYGDAIPQISQRKFSLVAIYIERAKLRDDLAHCPSASQGECTLPQDLWATVLRAVLHHDDDFCVVGIRDQIHGTADACGDL